MVPGIGLIIIGDEILSGKRADKHMTKVLELLSARGLGLAWVEYVGDDPVRITSSLRAAFASGDIVFSCGGIGATPDDRTRQCAARALGVELALHPEAEALIRERMQDMAREQGLPYEPHRSDNVQRLQMGMFPVGARIIPNPYNKIPGFSCFGRGAGAVHFVPGFPVMAWPMIEWVLQRYYAALFHREPQQERAVRIHGIQESELVALMERIERAHPRVRTFSLPSVDDPVHGRHIEIGVKGAVPSVTAAWEELLAGLHDIGAQIGPETVQNR